MTSFEHLEACARRAARGKRHRRDVSAFMFDLEGNVLDLQRRLQDQSWAPSGYREFLVREPKMRTISAAPFADRVVHHALVGVLEPAWEPTFIHDSYACRRGKGTHAAVRRYRSWLEGSRFFLKMDIEKFFPTVDHHVLVGLLARRIKDGRVLELARRIVDGSNPQEFVLQYYPGDDLFTPLERRRGLPIGNQTSQFFANVLLDPLDHFIKERLRIGRYLRYVDDLVILGDDRPGLHEARRAIEVFLQGLRLRLTPRKTHLAPVNQGVRLLGYRVFPDRVRLLPGNLTRTRRRLRRLQSRYAEGRIPLGRVADSVRAWIGHAAHADSWRIRERILADHPFRLLGQGGAPPEERG